MHRSLIRWFPAMGIGAVAIAASNAAKADVPPTCPPQQVIFLFDQSGSMTDASVQPNKSKWEVGLEKAKADLVALPANSQVSVIGFGNLDHGDANYYHVSTALGSVVLKNAANLASLNAALTAAALPESVATPLAAAACDALREIWTYNPSCTDTTVRELYIYSDGMESGSPNGSVPGVPAHPCWGWRSNTPFDANLAGLGFGLEADSWERKVANFAYNANPNLDNDPQFDAIPWYRPVVNVRLLFDNFGNLSSRANGTDGPLVLSPDQLDNVDANGVAFFKGLAKVSFGNYTESKLNSNGTPSKLAHAGDTDPSPTRSCVDQADSNRVIAAMNRRVRNNDPIYSGEDLAMRDVNNDLMVNILDYQLVMANYGQCS